MTSPAPITSDQSIPEIVKQYPATQAIFEKHGIRTNYKALDYETLLASATVNQVDIEVLLTELNAAVSASSS